MKPEKLEEVKTLYLLGFTVREIKYMLRLQLSEDSLEGLLRRRGLRRKKYYAGGWLYCTGCARWIHASMAERGKFGRFLWPMCPRCGRRLRTSPR